MTHLDDERDPDSGSTGNPVAVSWGVDFTAYAAAIAAANERSRAELAAIALDDFRCAYVVTDEGQRRALCDFCAPAYLGLDLGEEIHTRPGEQCLGCGARRQPPLIEALTAAVNALADAVGHGASAGQLIGVLDDVQYAIARDRWKDGDGPAPSQAPARAHAGCVGCLADATHHRRARPDDRAGRS